MKRIYVIMLSMLALHGSVVCMQKFYGLSAKNKTELASLALQGEAAFNAIAMKKYGFNYTEYTKWLAKQPVLALPSTEQGKPTQSTARPVAHPAPAPAQGAPSQAIVRPGQVLVPKGQLVKPATSSAIIVSEEELVDIPDLTNNPELNRIIALAFAATDANRIKQLKVQAQKFPEANQKILGLFDHYIDTLPNVLKYREDKKQEFAKKFEPKMLLIFDHLRDLQKQLGSSQETAQQKSQMLVAFNDTINEALRRISHFYYEVGGIPALQRKLLLLRARLHEIVGAKPETKPVTFESYYNTLGIAKNATTDDIKKAYRALVLQYHPDKNPAGLTKEQAQEKFFAIQEAYAVLSDPTERARYDAGNL